MDLKRFNVDDIHDLRVKNGERWSKMKPEEVEQEIREKSGAVQREIEAIRKAKGIRFNESRGLSL